MAIGFPPFLRNSADAVVRQLAKARSYAQSHPRGVQGLIGGLTAPVDPNQLGQEGFFSGFQRGLAGSNAAVRQYDMQTHEQARQAAQDAAAQERLRIEQERLGLERRRVAVAERPDSGQAAEDYTVPVTDAEGDIQRAEPFYLQGVPPALKKTAGAQFFQRQGGGDSSDMERRLAYRIKLGMSEEDAIKATLAESEKSPEDAVPPMDDATLRMAALGYAKTMQLPTLGMGRNAANARVKILNYAAHEFPALDVAANKADFAKNQRALTSIQNLYDSATAFESTALANADVMMETVNGIPDIGLRFGNKVGRYLASQAGSPQVAAFNTALETVKPEFARLLASPGSATGGSMLTDTARRDMGAIMGGDFTKQQLERSLGILKLDAHNRRVAYSNQIDRIRTRLAWNQTGANPNFNVAGQQQGLGGTIEWIMDANGNLVRKGQ